MNSEYLADLISEKEHGFQAAVILFGLWLLELLYAVGLALYLLLEKVGIRKREHLGAPVVSVGNLSVGGTGKTPVTQWLVKNLISQGFTPAILSRGHGGTITPGNAVISEFDGVLKRSVAEAGDEATLLASSLPGTPVVVGKDRRVSGKMALALGAVNVIVLDDGFQYWQLYRDLDIVLLDALKPFANGHALPRGLLREPKRNLSRAGMVIFTRSGSLDDNQKRSLKRQAQRLSPYAPVFFSTHVFDSIIPMNPQALERPIGAAFAVCGIGQPESFLSMIRDDTKVELVGEPLVFRDHQDYGVAEVAEIKTKARFYGAQSVLVTEKDAVKLVETGFDMPLYAAKIKIEIDDESRFWKCFSERINKT